MDYKSSYDKLNAAQKEAVDTTEGPLLVVAGPGTGKTQLLSARVARILETTDTLPYNILCLTFTESGATNMRERLTRFIGKDAYDVTISTYHAFGGDIINRFNQYFEDEQLTSPMDNLKKHQVVAKIVESLSYSDALKQTRHHIKDLIATISEVKRALLTPNDLRELADENERFLNAINLELLSIFEGFKIMPRKADDALVYFSKALAAIDKHIPANPTNTQFGSLAEIVRLELNSAIEQTVASGKTNPLTQWKKDWLEKDADNQFIFAGRLPNRRLRSLANVLDTYQNVLSQGGLYDFDDMILRAIAVLEKNDDLRYTLQEQYLYILLDEYQDTNAAQARLVQLLTDNPVNEGRPNVMAVGDDDQAIYAFQGAQYSNMLDFFQHYTDTRLINLSENYRSHKDILATATNIAEQIDARLFHQFAGASKKLAASNPALTSSLIERREFQSNIAENVYVAEKIKELIDAGTEPSEIAVLTPKHSLLERFVPYANAHKIPLHYEKRENILETPVINQLLTMSRLVIRLAESDESADSLWPEVLSYEFYALPVTTIWNIGWQVKDHNRTNDTKTTWTQKMLASDNAELRSIARFFLGLANRVAAESCEIMLDYLIGSSPLIINELDQSEVISPMRLYLNEKSEQEFYDTVSHLTVLRAKLRDYQSSSDSQAKLPELLQLVDAYNAADERMLNTSPYHQSDNAVQLMTVFKAKGLEFEHVFLLSVDDDTWGGSGQSMSNKLTLPKNLAPIRHSGATEDERLRLVFVAITRAKKALYLTSSIQNYNGKATKRLKYLDEREQEDGSFASYVIPESQNRIVQSSDNTPPPLTSLEISWQSRHLGGLDASLKDLLAERIAKYQLSPSDLNTFLDLKYGGPNNFLFKTLLCFPTAAGIDSQYGTAIHSVLRWLQNQFKENGTLPAQEKVHAYVTQQIARLKLSEGDTERLTERGIRAIDVFIAKRGHIFSADDKAEVNFRHENIMIGDAHMTGIIDRMEIDTKAKTITVVDYKTGTSSYEKIAKYSRQLYCYKLLIENSRTFKDYTVQGGRLEFIEPDGDDSIEIKEVSFKAEELQKVKNLIQIMWQKVQALDFPDVSEYPPTTAGSKQFEKDLLNLYLTEAG